MTSVELSGTKKGVGYVNYIINKPESNKNITVLC
jgi:hypothetical protein